MKLGRSFRHSRAGGRPMPGLSPKCGGFFDEPGLCVMLRKELGLSDHQLGEMSFERLCDLCVQSLASATQKAAVGRVLHQRVLEAVNRIGRRTALEHQFGTDEASKRNLQLVV